MTSRIFSRCSARVVRRTTSSWISAGHPEIAGGLHVFSVSRRRKMTGRFWSLKHENPDKNPKLKSAQPAVSKMSGLYDCRRQRARREHALPTGCSCPTRSFFFRRDRPLIVLSDLEMTAPPQHAHCRVASLTAYQQKLRRTSVKLPRLPHVIREIARAKNPRAIVPDNFRSVWQGFEKSSIN